MRGLFYFLRENIKIIDRAIVCLFLTWAMLLATAVVVSKCAKHTDIGESITGKINKIYEWCQGALAPAE